MSAKKKAANKKMDVEKDSMHHKEQYSKQFFKSMRIGTATLKKIIFTLYSIGIVLTSCILLAPGTFFFPPGIGLEESWKIGLNLAVENNFLFGEDIIFTYGPLSYFATRVPIGISKTQFLLWDIFVFTNIAFVLFYILKRLRTYLSLFFVFLSVLIISVISVYSYSIYSVMFLLFMFMVFHYLKHGSVITLMLASLNSLFLFYMKVNIGIAALFLMFVFLLYLYFYPVRQKKKFIIVYSILFVVVVYASSFVLNTNLFGYVKGALQLAKSYNESSSLPVENNPLGMKSLYIALAMIFSFSFAFLIHTRKLIKDKNALLQYLFTSIFIFMLFKQSFVRADLHV
ncbi:MAG: oligosaccharide repeat unit polymerase, partial [Deltaproteobacteria bacterium]|nr:oligosaccharide repeat unit polymerase [Deltaproteobacteria bacterium]